MCGRYYIDDDIDDEELKVLFKAIQMKIDSMGGIYITEDKNNFDKIKLSGEIFPTNIVPIVANSKSLAPTPFLMKWGYTAPWDEKKQVINARSETASSKGMFKDGMKNRRCLIPATNYFEWQKTDAGKVKHAIKPRGSNVLYMAGLYRIEHEKPVFTILTRNPAPEISFIHDRMPVILPKVIHKDWLDINNNADEVLESALQDMEFKTA